ncbi:MAG: hypothetical protein ABI406_04925 [Ktedonobacteraceae bacterium]
MNELLWEQGLDIASLVEVGAINRAHTRCGAWVGRASTRYGAWRDPRP